MLGHICWTTNLSCVCHFAPGSNFWFLLVDTICTAMELCSPYIFVLQLGLPVLYLLWSQFRSIVPDCGKASNKKWEKTQPYWFHLYCCSEIDAAKHWDKVSKNWEHLYKMILFTHRIKCMSTTKKYLRLLNGLSFCIKSRISKQSGHCIQKRSVSGRKLNVRKFIDHAQYISHVLTTY